MNTITSKNKKRKKTLTYDEFVEKEVKDKEDNNNSNKPILLITYIFAGLFLILIGYIIKFMYFDSTNIIANSYNKRSDLFADKVVRGQLLSIDGKVLAESVENSDGTYSRQYNYGKMFAHVIGYASKGKSGLELTANYYLLTSHANIFERISNELKGEKNIGDNVVTTLNYDLQNTAYQALGDRKGAVIVLEPSTGKILAMVSKPDFDPNEIDEIWDSINSSDESLLLNRATQGLYPPGSTFKVLTALEYIQENPNAYSDFSYNCSGSDIFNSVSISCYNNTSHGTVDLSHAMAYSCNDSFAQIGTTLNISKLNKLCTTFLFNKNLPYDGIYSKSSFVLDGNSNKNQIPQTVIGQGDTLVTPLHNALIMATIANGGVMMKPYLIDHVENYSGTLVKKFTPSSYKKLITATEAEKMQELLVGVVDYGTASSLSNSNYSVAGKTGSAEFYSGDTCHGWFVGYSNVENPDIVVSIVVEGVSRGSSEALPIAKQIFDTYYSLQ